jgi:hypothetical protein
MAKRSTQTTIIQLLTVAQLAARWQVTDDYLYRTVLGRPNGIPAFRLGHGPRRPWRIALADVERYEESRKVCYAPVAELARKRRGAA